ncbi:ankyrin-3-like [Haliotis rubra]|uniref:ankyrin-3-like n=1 Tax=Haliotis rubra TaxID=36100 RepID=UPI001EE5E07C|nr:ankyrin-3-like [Haliotis rubra]
MLKICKLDKMSKKAILEGNQKKLRELLETISKMGLEEILQSLTEAEDGSEHTFLCVAVQQGSIDMVRELVEFQDVHMTECCRPLLQTCLQHDNLQLAKYLLENEYETSATDQSMLMPQLCEQNNTSAVELLLEHGCDVNTRSTAGFTLLQIACTKNYCELLRTLLRYNPDVVKADSDGNTVLHQSVNQRLKDIVATLVHYLQRNNQNLNCRNKEGNTALMIAIKGKDVETANILLEYNMAVNTVNNKGDTPLHYACNIPSMDIVTFLLRRDAHVNISNKQGVTPLHVASSNGDLKTIQHVDERSTCQKTSRSHDTLCIRDGIVHVLLKRGADVNLQTVTGDTALHYACRHGTHSAVGALIKADALIEVKNKFGEVPLHLACMTPWSTEISLLLTCSVVDMKTAAGNTPLHLACSSNNTNAVQTLLNMEADVNAQNNGHHTPLCIAFGRKSHGALEILLNKYRPTNLKHVMCSTNENRCAAAWLACSKVEHPTAFYSDFTLIKEPILEHLCRRNNLEDMERLLMQDVSLETINQCLYLACTLRHVSIIMALLEHNANPGWKTRNDNTSLHAAVASNSEETVSALLSAKNIKECINAKNKTGDTALHIACRHTHTGILKPLLKSGADPNIRNTSDEAPLHVACKQKDAKTVEILLEKGFDANSLARGYSPLHTACKYSNLAVVRVLVEYKANVNAAARMTTPLHVAEKERKEDIVRYLIQNGANKLARDVDQRTPLAYRYYANGHAHITPDVELLLNKGSDVNRALSDGNIALIHEVRENHLDVVKELVREGGNH